LVTAGVFYDRNQTTLGLDRRGADAGLFAWGLESGDEGGSRISKSATTYSSILYLYQLTVARYPVHLANIRPATIQTMRERRIAHFALEWKN